MDLIELNAELEFSKQAYMSAKILQGVYQIPFLIFLLGHLEKEMVNFIAVTCFITSLVLVTYFLMEKYGEKLFSTDRIYKEYISLIAMDILVFSTAFIAYHFAIKTVTKYGDYKEELYYAHHSEDSQGLKENELNRSARNLSESPIDKHLNMLDNLLDPLDIFSFHVNENLEPENISMIQSSEELSHQKFDEFYFKYVTLQLVIPSIICTIIQLFPVVALVRIEIAKYKIRKAQQLRLNSRMPEIQGEEDTLQ